MWIGGDEAWLSVSARRDPALTSPTDWNVLLAAAIVPPVAIFDSVRVLFDGSLVDNTTEAANVVQYLRTSAGHDVQLFNMSANITELLMGGVDTVVIPELERGSMVNNMTLQDALALR